MSSRSYEDLLKAKLRIAERAGFDVDLSEINPHIKGFNQLAVQWALRGGRRAVFASYGLHKTVTQIEVMRLIGKHRPCTRLIGLPLGVRQEFVSDAETYFRDEYSVRMKFIRTHEEIEDIETIYLTNYEAIREAKIGIDLFGAVSFDEADVLRSFGSKTFSELLFGPVQNVPLRFVNTATPSPNDYIELLAYSQFLGIMDIGEAKTRFFQRDSEQADNLTLRPDAEQDFWLWVSTWALFIHKPSDLGFSDEGYEQPPLEVHWHEIPSSHSDAGTTKKGQHKLLKDENLGVSDSAAEKRLSLPDRIAKLMELRELDPQAHRIIWHDLEDERRAIEQAIPTAVTVYGTQDDDAKEAAIVGFRNGTVAELAAKPVMLGGGGNYQYHCAWAVFLGIGFKFRDFIQAIHRLQRFGQSKPVRIDLIYTEAERGVRSNLERKWQQDREQRTIMGAIIRQYGLSEAAAAAALQRSMGTEREEASGEGWLLAKNDSVEETRAMATGSVQGIVTSIPFSGQYEYSASLNDFGHNETDEAFFEQMDHLSPEMFRVLEPGRVCCVHVKDRAVPGVMLDISYQSISPFHAFAIQHYMRHGFTYMGMITVVTDVVRENAQTYRLSWTQQCKDGTRMSVGLPEYVLIFRKPPSDARRGYADNPVVKSKDDYTRGRWQFDAHSFWRSSGDRLLAPEDLRGLSVKQIFRLFRKASEGEIYDHERMVAIAEECDRLGQLRPDFMVLQPRSHHPDVWMDIMRARGLNTAQARRRKEKHLCPLPFDIVDRLIQRFTNPGDLVFDPFSGLGTVPLLAAKAGRRGRGCELNRTYWLDSISHLKAAEAQATIPSLFDLDQIEEEEAR